jgi:hypothetical protein
MHHTAVFVLAGVGALDVPTFWDVGLQLLLLMIVMPVGGSVLGLCNHRWATHQSHKQ